MPRDGRTRLCWLLCAAMIGLATSAGAQEDCANGIDDDGMNGADCADPVCAGDPFCDPCTIDYTFDTGGGGWNWDTSVWSYQSVEGRWEAAGYSSGDDQGRLSRSVAVPSVSQGGPRPELEVIYSLNGNPHPWFDVFGVCIDDPTCGGGDPDLAYETGYNSAPPSRPTDIASDHDYSDGTNDHVFVDLSTYVGQVITLGILFDEITDLGSFSGLAVDRVRIASDVDRDGVYEGTDPSCDQCWDGDGDGYFHSDSPGLPLFTCSPTAPDCDDADPSTNPGAAENCAVPGDEDCDGLADLEDPDCSPPAAVPSVNGMGAAILAVALALTGSVRMR